MGNLSIGLGSIQKLLNQLGKDMPSFERIYLDSHAPDFSGAYKWETKHG